MRHIENALPLWNILTSTESLLNVKWKVANNFPWGVYGGEETLRKHFEKEANGQASRSTVPDAQREWTLNFQCSSQAYNLDLMKCCSDTTFPEAARSLSTLTGSDTLHNSGTFNIEYSKVQYVFWLRKYAPISWKEPW